jgi:hypothetical protein
LSVGSAENRERWLGCRHNGHDGVTRWLRSRRRTIISVANRHYEVANAMKRCVLRQELDATTRREVGRKAGCTTGVVTHHSSENAAVARAWFETVSDDWTGGVEPLTAPAPSHR